MNKTAKIIPLKKLPRKLEAFDYIVPENLISVCNPGAIVSIIFKNSKMLGLVAEVFDQRGPSKYKLKEVLAIEDSELISEYQIKFIKWFSEYYHYSLASSVKLILPDFPKKRGEYGKKEGLETGKKIESTGKSLNLAKTIFSGKEKGCLLINNNTRLMTEFYADLAALRTKSKRQILFLFPTVAEISKFYDLLPPEVKKVAVILDSKAYKTSKNKYLEYYRLVADNQFKVLIGTRSALFFNLKNVAEIVIDRAEADDYKQWDQSPRYQASELAFKLAEFLPAKLIVSGFAPKVEDYYRCAQEKFKMISIGQTMPEKNIQRVVFSSGGENYYLTDNLDQFIKKGIEKKEKILLLVNKRGVAGSLICKDCEKIIECENCKLPLTVYPGNKLFCHHCLKYFEMPVNCSNCGGVNLFSSGIGEAGFSEFIKKKYAYPDITVGLPSLIDDDRIYDRAALAYFDSLFYLPDFSYSGKIFGDLRKTVAMLYSQNNNLKFLIQSNFLNNFAVCDFLLSPIEFYKKELFVRKQFKYPPYFSLFKIIVRDKSEIAAQKKADDIYEKIKEIAGLEISPPYPAYTKKIRDYYVWQMAVKLLKNEAENEFISNLSDDVIIDKNPLNLL
ncbi:MAG TPA: hypothetical protein VMX18_00625 [Candidatus Bipolaricaulota bacterium]|nr:hypothetical protein [Candidatus Bipolaricaulota bacterium]